jgi:hypothetical protein
MTPDDIKAAIELANEVYRRNLSSKFGHPKYTANINSQELRTILDALLALADERERMEKVVEAAERVGIAWPLLTATNPELHQLAKSVSALATRSQGGGA